MTAVIHFLGGGNILNIGDAAAAYSIQDLLHRYLKISTYTSMDVFKLKGVTRHLHLQLTKFRSPKTINKYDLCVIGGGGLYSKWLFPLNSQLIKSIKIPLILYGIGYNVDLGDSPLPKAKIGSIVLLNRHATLSSVRDIDTYQFLRKLNLVNIDVIGDPAIFLETKKVKTTALCTSRMRIGINIAQHRWKLQSHCLNKVLTAYLKTCKFLIQKQDAELVYLKHTPREDTVIQALRRKMPISVVDCCPAYSLAYRFRGKLPILPIRIEECRPYELQHVYSTLDLVISMHMHSAVFAFANGVPVINVAYNLKNYGFMKLIHQDDKVIRVDRIDSGELKKMILRALDNSIEIKKSFEHLKDKLWEKQSAFLKKIQSL